MQVNLGRLVGRYQRVPITQRQVLPVAPVGIADRNVCTKCVYFMQKA